MYQVPCDAGTYSDKPGSVSSHLYLNFSHFGVHMIFYIFLPTFLTYILIFSYLLTYPPQTTCEECVAGYVCKTQAASYDENPCEAGNYCPAGSSEQKPCQPGLLCHP